MSDELAVQRWLKNLGRAVLWWIAPPVAALVNRELRGQGYGYAVLRLPRARAPVVPPEAAEHRVVSQLRPNASAAEIAASIDGQRSIMNAERFTLKASGDFVLACCSCGHAHRLSYEPVIDETNELVLEVLVRNDDTLTTKLRRDYSWPFQKAVVHRRNGIIGGH